MPTNYPGSLDTWTDKVDGVDDVDAAHVNNLQDAVEAVQTELGTNPSGSSATVAAAIALKGNKAGETWTGTHDFTGATVTGISGGGAVSSVVGQTGDVTGTQILADTTVAAALTAKAPVASPTFTGTPAAPTAAADTSTTQVATTAFVVGQAGSSTPVVNGTAAVGTSTRFARQDHVHGTDTSRAPLASPTFTGTPAAPTPALGDRDTSIATTAFVGQSFNVFYPETYGALGDWRQVADAAMTSGSAVLTSSTAAFTAGDVGKWVSVQGAGAAGIDLVTTISAYTSATQVTLAASASTTVTAKYLDIGTDDTSALQQAINAACAVNGTVRLAAKTYVVNTAPSVSGGMNAILKFPTASPFSVTVEGVSPAEQAESMFISTTPFPVSLSAIRTFRVSDTFTSDPPPAVMAANRVAANITLKNFAIVAPRNPRICGVDFGPGAGGGASRCEFNGFAVVTDWRGTQPVDGNTCDAYWPFGIRTPGHSNYDKVLVTSALVCGFWTGWIGAPEHFTALDLVTHRNRIGIAWYGPQNAHAAVLHKLSAEYCTYLFAQWDPAGTSVTPGVAPFQAATYPFVVDLADLENTEVIIDPYNKLRGVLNYFQYKAAGIDRGLLNVSGGKGLKITNLMRLGDGTVVPDDSRSIIVKDGWLTGTNKPTLAAGTSGFGNCLVFDGTGSTGSTVCAVNLGLPAAQNTEGWAPSGTTPFTVELIFKRGRSGVAETLIGAWSTAAGGGRYELQLTAGNVLQGVMRGAGTTNYIATGSGTVTDTAWHSAALSYDGTNMRVFLDGSLQATVAAVSSSSPNSTLEMYVGARPSGEQPFQGSLDEVRISRVARYTSGYTAASAPFTSDSNTIALYHFDEIY